jgi:hypothetical protein
LGYIVVLTIYQIYHTWIYSSTILLYFLLPHSRKSSNRYLFSIYTRVHNIRTIFTLLHFFSNSFTLPLVSTPHPVLPIPPPTQGRKCYSLLFSDFAKERKKK